MKNTNKNTSIFPKNFFRDNKGNICETIPTFMNMFIFNTEETD